MRRGMALKYTSRSRVTGSSTVPSRIVRRKAPSRGPTVPQRSAAQLAGQCLHRAHALGGAGNDGSAVRFAEENLIRREACGVRREIHIQTEARFLIWAAHRHLGEGDAQAAVRAVVRGAEQAAPPLGAGDEE